MIESGTTIDDVQVVKFINIPDSDTLKNYSSYINVIKGDGCYSYVGNLKSRRAQDLSLAEDCMPPGIIAHEFIHALGT